MSRTVVGVLRGGPSSEYDLSLKTGAAILNALPEDQYDTRDIFIDKRGYWHMRGMPAEAPRILSQVDVVLSGLHGGVGEDGTVQRILESANVPYAGSSPLASALSLNKIRAGNVLRHAGLRMPRAAAFFARTGMDAGEMSRLVFADFGPPYIVKPSSEGASYGIAIASAIVDLPVVLADVLNAHGSALVEEYVIGENATVGVVEDFRDEDVYAFPPVRIELPDESPFLHFNHHLEGTLKHYAPSDFTHLEKQALVDAAKQAHRALGLSDYSRADFIMTKRGPYLLEVNSLPGLHENASFSHMLTSVGSTLKDFLGHVIGLARK